MARVLFELCGEDRDVRFSPYVWLVKLALAHKGLAYESEAVRFVEKSKLPDPEHGKVPQFRDGEAVIVESWDICAYLDKTYPEHPLTATQSERASAEFYRAWVGSTLFPILGPLLMVRIPPHLDAPSAAYFRESREQRFGVTLEQLAEQGQGKVKGMPGALAPLATALSTAPYLGGEAPNLSDYVVFMPFIWQRGVCGEALYETPAPVAAWLDRMCAAHGGVAGKAKAAA